MSDEPPKPRLCRPDRRLCGNGRNCCGALSPGGLGCTNFKNHAGPHVACGVVKHNYETWNDDGSPPVEFYGNEED